MTTLTIDYDIYAKGEAKLAWFDQELEIYSANNNAMQQAEDFINIIYSKIIECQYAIGHLKFLIRGEIKVSFTGYKQPPVELKIEPAASVSVLINLRLQTEPGIVTQLVAAAVNETEMQSGCKIMLKSLTAFQPGYPKPAYRI